MRRPLHVAPMSVTARLLSATAAPTPAPRTKQRLGPEQPCERWAETFSD